jgi:hypothetical protein
MFHLTGLLPHVDVGPILEVSRDAEKLFDRTLPGRLLRTGPMQVAEASASGSEIAR